MWFYSMLEQSQSEQSDNRTIVLESAQDKPDAIDTKVSIKQSDIHFSIKYV